MCAVGLAMAWERDWQPTGCETKVVIQVHFGDSHGKNYCERLPCAISKLCNNSYHYWVFSCVPGFSKHLLAFPSMKPSNNYMRWVLLLSTFQSVETELGILNNSPQGHTTSEWQGWNLNPKPGLTHSEACALITLILHRAACELHWVCFTGLVAYSSARHMVITQHSFPHEYSQKYEFKHTLCQAPW